MIDLQKFMVLAMKGQMYIGENKDALNLSARHVIGEMKTKYVDIKEEITNEDLVRDETTDPENGSEG